MTKYEIILYWSEAAGALAGQLDFQWHCRSGMVEKIANRKGLAPFFADGMQ